MKLKKIASLALAGVMAVSMLAACGTGANTNTTPNTDTETSTGSDLAAIMNGRVTTPFKVTYTEDTKTSKVMQQILDTYGMTVTTDSTNYQKAVLDMANVKGNTSVGLTAYTRDDSTDKNVTWGGYMLNSKATYEGSYVKEKGDLDGKSYTVYGMYVMTGFDTEEAAVNAFGAQLNKYLGQSVKLASTQVTTGLKGGAKYYAYDYEGTISTASVKDTTGTTVYVILYTVTQNVTAETLD